MLNAIFNAVSRRSRAAKLRQFMRLMEDGETVVDVGVSGVVEFRAEPINHFLAHYPRNPSTYAGLSIDDVSALEAAYPKHRFIRYDGTLMPFADRSFDWVFSNAVIEHVGDDDAQLLFVNEMLRIAYRVYFTTPNRFFPVETHTGQLFRHWSRKSFHGWAERTGKDWLTYPALNLLSRRDLVTLIARSSAKYFAIRSNRFCGWPMTFSVLAHAYEFPTGHRSDAHPSR